MSRPVVTNDVDRLMSCLFLYFGVVLIAYRAAGSDRWWAGLLGALALGIHHGLAWRDEK